MAIKKFSFVSPVYKCRDCLPKLIDEIDKSCSKIGVDHEVILVDDNCPDDSWEMIKSLAKQKGQVKGLKLSRNFGQHSAIAAGLSIATGDWISVLDCDLQDHPEAIPKMWELVQKNDDLEVVVVKRVNRTDTWYRKVLSSTFYKFLSFMTGSNISPEIANYGIYKRSVIDTLNSWQEEQKYFPVMVQWMGFEQETLEVPHTNRFSGKSSYNFKSLLSLGIQVILSFSDRPLWLMSMLGCIIWTTALTVSALVLTLALFGQIQVEGWTSIVLSIWFLGGVNIAVAGLLGIYLGRTLREAKGRPSFIISKIVSKNEN